MRNGGTAIWQGFDFEWSNTPHRLHNFGSWLVDLQTQNGQIQGACETSFTVGRVPDTGVAKTWIKPIRSPDLRFHEGAQTLEITAVIGQSAETIGTLIEVQLAPNQTGTAVLRGFHIRCVSHPMGLHPEGMGVRLTELSNEGQKVRFIPVFFFHATNSPDIVTTGSGPVVFTCEVLYTVVVAERETVKLTVPCNQNPCVTHQHRRGEVQKLSTTLQGVAQPSLNHGVIGVRGFVWRQQHPSYFQRNGRFIRRYQMHTGAMQYDAALGKSQIKPRLHFCNNGLIPYPIQAHHQLWTTLIQYRDERPALAARVEEHAIKTGVGEGGLGRSRFAI